MLLAWFYNANYLIDGCSKYVTMVGCTVNYCFTLKKKDESLKVLFS